MSRNPNDELHDILQSLFSVVLDRARNDERFQKQLLQALSKRGDFRSVAKQAVDWSNRAPTIDLRSKANDLNSSDFRAFLSGFTVDQLYAMVKAQKISPKGTSRLTKIPLIQHIERHAVARKPEAEFQY